ncbi:MAG TPA: UDP-3-O-(3-hydroxymyristoyl)glucosamine N-acyltransferase [Phycisphaerales bacterium]|nr:UDP-3-O-(3-hydroxymyristoyl)glucosamine N-acyltransferase [Phycisphaerales bacterium]
MTTADALSITSGDLAALIGGRLIGPGDVVLTGINSLEHAGPGDLSFVRRDLFVSKAKASKAGALLVAEAIDTDQLADPPGRALIVVPSPDRSLIDLLGALRRQRFGAEPVGIHPSAIVDDDAEVGEEVWIGPNAVIEADVTIGDRSRIGPGSILHMGTQIGNDCVVGANVVIGSEGFGYVADPTTGKHTRLPHVGTVVIEDRVEIGAGTCIDRAKFGITRIGAGTKIDNLVQIGHNVSIGKDCILCGLVGVAGSVVIEDNVVIGGQTGIGDGLTVGKGAQLAARGGILNDVPPGASYYGSPAKERGQALREFAALRRLASEKRKK